MDSRSVADSGRGGEGLAMALHTVMRKLEIDAAHRVPLHNSKCRFIHGHRYVIEATCTIPELVQEGAQTGMVMDFGFLKDVMVEVIEKWADHALILCVDDPYFQFLQKVPSHDPHNVETMRAWIERDGFGGILRVGEFPLKLCIIDEVPTAENLAMVWFKTLDKRMKWLHEHNLGGVPDGCQLVKVRVWETPNCYADYEPDILWPAGTPLIPVGEL